MAKKKKTVKEKLIEDKLKNLSRAFADCGISVRREKLARGAAFRVKSGNCQLTGDNVLFLDKRLSSDQQLSLLADYAVDLELELPEETLPSLTPSARAQLEKRAP